ncbi:hypothetical protein B0A48_03266 [Cryoendolithus antarcticus]|uniref:Uncharacterized protein n=1 Tax=Cryoendolithus antarcticus TaxID=1507870 RepID=A0A1V8TJI8_9PEZI|nr:hypothetical protein B0A48_03266 [Cryoendolithus antarcticus]
MGNSSSQPTPATTARKPNFVQEVFTSTPKMSRDQEQPKGALHALQEATRKGKKSKRRKRHVEAEDEEMRRSQLSQVEPEVDMGMEVKETQEEILYDVAEEDAEIVEPAKSRKRMSREVKELQRMEAEADIAAASAQVVMEAAEPVAKKLKKSRGKPSGFDAVQASKDVRQHAVQSKHTQGPTPPSDPVSLTPGPRTALAYGTDRSKFTADWATSAEHASTVRLSQSEYSPTRQAFRSQRQREALDAGEPAAKPDAERAEEVARDRERTLELRAVQDATEAYLAPFNADPNEQDIVSPDFDDIMAERTAQDDPVAATEPAAQRPKRKLKRKRPSQPLADMQQGPAPPTEILAREKSLTPAASRPVLRERAMPGGYNERTITEEIGRNTDEGRPAKHNPIKGPFSDAEKALADEIYHHCLQRSGMTEAEFKAQILNWRDATILKNAVQDALPNRPIVAIRKFCQRRYHNAETGTWTAEQDEALRKACVSNPGRWVEISALVGRTAASCKDRWRNQVDLPEAHRVGKWAADEESTLREAVRIATDLLQSQQDDPLPTDPTKLSSLLAWQPIADKVPARSAKQCREKWSKLNRTRSRKLDRAERKYAMCEVGDIHAMLTEIHTAVSDHSIPYEPESRLWATISRANPTSCYSSAMRRLAIEDAKANYEESVDVSGTVAAVAKALTEHLEQEWDAQILRDQRTFKPADGQQVPDNGTESSGFVGNAQKRLEAQQHLAEEQDRKLAEKRAQRGAAKKARKEAGKQALKERIKKLQSSPGGRYKSAAQVVESDEDDDEAEPQTVQRTAPISGRGSFVAPQDPSTVDPIQDDTSPDKASAVRPSVVKPSVQSSAMAALVTHESRRKGVAQLDTNGDHATRKPTAKPKATRPPRPTAAAAPGDDAPESLVSADPKSPTTRKSTGHIAVPGKFAAKAKWFEDHNGDYLKK